jgi:HK97 family phage major capsid protein
MVTKTTIPAGTTTDSTWAAPLVYANTFTGDFIEYLRPRTLIGQAQFQPIPFNVRIPSQTSGGTAGWVGQGKSKPVTKFDFNAVSTSYTKIAAITVMTQELMRLSDPSAQAIVRNQLAQAVIARADSDLFDPDLAAVANVNPAGLLNGISPVSVSAIDYGDPATVRCAIAALWAPWDSTFLGMRPAYYTTPAVARQLSLSREALGTQAFPGVTMTGGTLDGIPLRVSQYLANNGGSGGAPFILVDESEVYLADDGNVTVDMSNEATIEMTDAPVGSTSATVTSNGSPFVSMFQTNSTAIRAERWIWWGLRRSGAIQWIDGFPTTC